MIQMNIRRFYLSSGLFLTQTNNPKLIINKNHKPETSNPEPKTSNQPQTINNKPGTRNLKPETRNPKPETATSSTHTYTQTFRQAACVYLPYSARDPEYRHG